MSGTAFKKVSGRESLLSLANKIKSDLPYSVTMYNSLLLHGNGFSGRDLFYTLQQHPSSNVVLWQRGDDPKAIGFHCRENETHLLQKALKETTDLFDIRKSIVVYSAADYIVDAIQETGKQEGCRLVARRHHTFVYHPESLEKPLRIQRGYVVKRLGRRGITYILQNSRYNKNSPFEEMHTFSQKAPFVGIFQSDEVEEETTIDVEDIPVAGDDETPVSCIASTLYGSLGLLYTEEAHRGRGLGSLVTQVCARIQTGLGLVPHSHVEVRNTPSEKMFDKMHGWRRTHSASWMFQDFDAVGDPDE